MGRKKESSQELSFFGVRPMIKRFGVTFLSCIGKYILFSCNTCHLILLLYTKALIRGEEERVTIQRFTELYSTVYEDLYRFAFCMMRQSHDAEDAVSEAVVLAYENIRSLRKEEAFRSWIFKITANVCKRKLKDKSRLEVELTENQKLYEEDRELQLDIHNALLELDEEERCIVAMSALEGYNSVEIGTMMKLNPNTVRSKRKRAIEKLGAIMKKQEV